MGPRPGRRDKVAKGGYRVRGQGQGIGRERAPPFPQRRGLLWAVPVPDPIASSGRILGGSTTPTVPLPLEIRISSLMR